MVIGRQGGATRERTLTFKSTIALRNKYMKYRRYEINIYGS